MMLERGLHGNRASGQEQFFACDKLGGTFTRWKGSESDRYQRCAGISVLAG
ncbi:MAG: hypothetical protein ABL869_13655 [Candidatus Nitrotoga sp.]